MDGGPSVSTPCPSVGGYTNFVSSTTRTELPPPASCTGRGGRKENPFLQKPSNIVDLFRTVKLFVPGAKRGTRLFRGVKEANKGDYRKLRHSALTTGPLKSFLHVRGGATVLSARHARPIRTSNKGRRPGPRRVQRRGSGRCSTLPLRNEILLSESERPGPTAEELL